MVIRGKAPLRISFAGGGTDIMPFCEQRGGAILGSTINKYAYCTIIPKQSEEIVVHSLDFDMTVKYHTKENYVYDGSLDLVKAALKKMKIKEGCEVYLQCDAPPGCGLGTSSTVMVALLSAMEKWKGMELDKYELANLAYEVEREELSIAGGFQDQYAATFGGFNFIEFHGKNNVIVNPLRIRKEIIQELEYSLLLCYTGNIHISANIIKDQVNNYNRKKENVLDAMSHVKAIAFAMKGELLKGNLYSFGKLLDYGWEYKKKMSDKITNPQIDEIYEKAKSVGALGGKLLGAGGGGYLLMYCPYNIRNKVANAMEQAGGQLSDWNFELKGSSSWKIDESRWNYKDVAVKIPEGTYQFPV